MVNLCDAGFFVTAGRRPRPLSKDSLFGIVLELSYDFFEDGTMYQIGGGVLIRDSSPGMVNCIIEYSLASSELGFGAGIFAGSYSGTCESIFTDCIIRNNIADASGGGGTCRCTQMPPFKIAHSHITVH